MPRGRLALACSALLWHAVVGGEDTQTAAPAKPLAEIERLIQQLGGNEFEEREAVRRAIVAAGRG